jgi:hypothetical protein
MSKILEATCEDEVVTSNGVEVPMAEILSKGLGASSGALLIEGKKVWYITSSASDLEQTLDKLISVLGSIKSAIESFDSMVLTTTCPSGAGTTAPPTVAAGDITEIDGVISDLEELKDNLK